MKVLMIAELPIEPFNTLVRAGKAGAIVGKIMETLKPESVYFTELDGMRTCIMAVDMNSTSEIPKYAEPFFLSFNAKCRFRMAMTPEDLQKSDLDAIGQMW